MAFGRLREAMDNVETEEDAFTDDAFIGRARKGEIRDMQVSFSGGRKLTLFYPDDMTPEEAERAVGHLEKEIESINKVVKVRMPEMADVPNIRRQAKADSTQ